MTCFDLKWLKVLNINSPPSLSVLVNIPTFLTTCNLVNENTHFSYRFILPKFHIGPPQLKYSLLV
jgi:hypothetical protein